MSNQFFEVVKVKDTPSITHFNNGVKLIAPDKYGVYRKDNGYCLTGKKSVGEGYTIVQPSQLFDVMQRAAQIAEIDSSKIKFIDLLGGRKIAYQLPIPGFLIDGSEIQRNLSYLDAYDATLSMTAGFSSTNIVCSNTWYSVHRDMESRFRHSKSITERVQIYSENMLQMLEENLAEKELFTEMSKIEIDEPVKERFIKAIAGFDSQDIRNGANEWSNRAITIRTNKVEMVQKAINHELNRFGNTFWGLFNAGTYMSTHLQLEGKNKNTNEHLFVGQGRKLNDNALQFIKQELKTV